MTTDKNEKTTSTEQPAATDEKNPAFLAIMQKLDSINNKLEHLEERFKSVEETAKKAQETAEDALWESRANSAYSTTSGERASSARAAGTSMSGAGLRGRHQSSYLEDD